VVSRDLGAVAKAPLTERRHGLAHMSIRLFRPVRPMHAQAAEDAGEAATIEMLRTLNQRRLNSESWVPITLLGGSETAKRT
jgi:hypothetical protein